MRAVTEPYSPPACDEPASPTRNTERRPLDTCAIDRRALDAVMADVAAIAAEADYADSHASSAVAADSAWMQLLRLEQLLREWMSANTDCDGAALAELGRSDQKLPVRAPSRRAAPAVASAPSDSVYVAQLAAKLVRRSA